MVNDVDWTQKANEERCLRNAKEVAAIFQPGHQLFLGPASEDSRWYGHPNKPSGHWDSTASKMADIFTCHTSHPGFPAAAPLSLGQLKKRWTNDHFQVTCENKLDSHQDHVGRQLAEYPQLYMPVVRGPKFGTFTEMIGRRRGHRFRSKRRTCHQLERLDAETHCELRNAESQGLRTGRVCQNSGDGTILHHT